MASFSEMVTDAVRVAAGGFRQFFLLEGEEGLRRRAAASPGSPGSATAESLFQDILEAA